MMTNTETKTMTNETITRAQTEEVFGSEIKIGDLLWSGGYLWAVDEVVKEATWQTMSDQRAGKTPDGRFCFTTHWSGIGSDPKFFNDDFSTARRADLKWTRVRPEIAKTLTVRAKGGK